MEQLALSERTLRSGVAAGGRHRPAGLHSPGLLDERYMHVEGPLDRIGTLSAFIWLVKTIDDAATTSTWTHACHVAGRRRMWPGRRAGRRRCRRWARGHPPPAGSHGRRRPCMASPAGIARPPAATIDLARTRCTDQQATTGRPQQATTCVRARTACTLRLATGTSARSYSTRTTSHPLARRRPDERAASLFVAGRPVGSSGGGRKQPPPLLRSSPAAACSNGRHAGRVAMSAGRPGRRTGSGHRSFSGTPSSIDRGALNSSIPSGSSGGCGRRIDRSAGT